MPAVSKALALEYAANNIRFNTVSPGNINTPMHAKDNHAALAKFHPLGRMDEISDIVDAVGEDEQEAKGMGVGLARVGATPRALSDYF